MKVLIVEDAGFIREILINIVQNEGHQVVAEAVNYNQAATVFENSEVNVAFIDLVLPDKNGLELAEDIRNSFPNTKIIVCTSLKQEIIREKAIKLGCYYLEKPFSEDQVKHLLKLCFEDLKNQETKKHG